MCFGVEGMKHHTGTVKSTCFHVTENERGMGWMAVWGPFSWASPWEYLYPTNFRIWQTSQETFRFDPSARPNLDSLDSKEFCWTASGGSQAQTGSNVPFDVPQMSPLLKVAPTPFCDTPCPLAIQLTGRTLQWFAHYSKLTYFTKQTIASLGIVLPYEASA